MKKSLNILFGALAIIAAASCAKEEKMLQGEASGEARTFTCAFEQTKTNLVDGKTVWAEGDSIWVSNGRAVEHFGVPAEAAGKKEFTFTSKLGGEIFVVYPLKAVEGEGLGLVDGKILFKVLSNQNGQFGSANVSVGKTLEDNVVLKNATAVMKFTIPEENTIFAKFVSLHSNGNPLTGLCSVDLSTGSPVVTATQTASDIQVDIDGVPGDYYVNVIPGEYKEGFTVSAVTTTLRVASKITTVANELKINDLVDLGELYKDADLKKLEGDGSDANPWLIHNFSEMLAFAYYVNANTENSMKGETVKLLSDIEGYSLPVGHTDYNVSPNVNYAFSGIFDGNGKSITVDINGDNTFSTNRVGLFGYVSNGATIKNLTVNGSVVGNNSVGGIIGYAIADEEPIKIENCFNKASVNGNQFVGGIAGYINQTKANLFSVIGGGNSGTVVGKSSYVGGLCGQVAGAFARTITSFVNTGNVSGTDYVGGVVGHIQNVTIDKSSNSGTVAGARNVGGITGYLYNSTATELSNTGNIISNGNNGGIYTLSEGSSGLVWCWRVFESGSTGRTNLNSSTFGVGGISGYIQNSTITFGSNNGKVEGKSKVGGIVGSSYGGTTKICSNTGSVIASGNIAGGIVGWVYTVHTSDGDKNGGSIEANAAVGGLFGVVNTIGYSSSNAVSNIKNAINTGNVHATGKMSFQIYADNLTNYCMVGGLVGLYIPQSPSSSRRGYATFTNMTNKGNVSGDGNGIGGAIGLYWTTYTNVTNTVLSNISNEGNVEGLGRVGGIIGDHWGRFINHDACSLRNVANYGTVKGGSSVGGLVGRSTYHSTSTKTSAGGTVIYNAVNNGQVLYTDDTNENPYVGGIFGYSIFGSITNGVNNGEIGTVTGVAPKEGAHKSIGAIVGFKGEFQNASNVFYLKHAGLNVIGTSSTNETVSIVSSFGKDGILDQNVTVNSVERTDVISALNAWVNNNSTYFNWSLTSFGPNFESPVGFGLSVGDQNLDLGNGGNI